MINLHDLIPTYLIFKIYIDKYIDNFYVKFLIL